MATTIMVEKALYTKLLADCKDSYCLFLKACLTMYYCVENAPLVGFETRPRRLHLEMYTSLLTTILVANIHFRVCGKRNLVSKLV